jgi:hypothetical protein
MGARSLTLDTLYVCSRAYCCCGIQSTELAYQQPPVTTRTSESLTACLYCEKVQMYEKYGQEL